MRWLQVSVRPRRFTTLATLVSGSILGGMLVAGTFGAGPAQAVLSDTMELFAGNGTTNALAEGARLSVPVPSPRSLATDAAGNVFILSVGASPRILKVDTAGAVSYFAGNGSAGAPTAGPATSSPFYNLQQIATNAAGDLFITDAGAGQILKVTAAGTLSMIRSGRTSYAITVAPNGDIYYANHNSGTIYQQTPAGVESAVASYDRNNIRIVGLAVNASGTVYASDLWNASIRKFAGGTMSTVTTAATNPQQLALDSDGSLLVTDSYTSLVLRISTPDATTPVVTTVAGSGSYGYGVAPQGPALTTALSSPFGVALDAGGSVYVADYTSNYVARIAAATAPDAPVLSATPADASARLSFTVPAANGSAIDHYEYRVGSGTWTTFTTTPAGTGPLTATITGLTNGTPAALTVRAVNTATPGDGAASNTITITPAAPPAPPAPVAPGAPSTPSASAGIASVTVSWSAGNPSEGTTGYTVTASPGAAACSTTATSCVIAGTPGTPYTFTVIAHSTAGDSPASAASGSATPLALVIPQTAPLDAPATLTTPEGQQSELEPAQDLTITGTGFAANTPAKVYAYSAPILLGTATTSPSGVLSLDVTIPAGLEPGEHNIVATGVAPDGTQHTIRMPFTLIPATVNGPAPAPAGVRVAASASRTFTVTFQKATAVTPAKTLGYQFSTSSGRHWKRLATTGKTTRTVKITGLANGRLYEVAVRAITSAGPGEMSVVIRAKAKRP